MSTSLVSGNKNEMAALPFSNDLNKYITLKHDCLIGEAIEADSEPVIETTLQNQGPIINDIERSGYDTRVQFRKQ